MKILRIRCQNLNSLCGIWEIDFTDPAYTEHSLFAIIGPTGAGKSTLLDGICLALYGATPRLGKVTKSSNEIMSRHTGLCFAEVEFSTTKGQFRCHWSQHRSRQKSDGDLQQPKHEIADGISGAILESSIRKVASKVEEVTGMDFDRFTRSTLLAQGSFAAFLQASANERAPILEQITGTEIYSRISIQVHELLGTEQQKLNEMKQGLDHIHLLTPEVEEELGIGIVQTEKEELLCKTKLTDLRKQHSHIEMINRLKAEKDACIQQLVLLEKEKQANKGTLDTLQPALAAKLLEPLHTELEKLLQSEKDTQKECRSLEKQSSDVAHTLKKTGTLVNTAKDTLLRAKQSRETGLLLIRNVQELDHSILTAKSTLREMTRKLSARKAARKKDHALIDALRQDLIKKQKSWKQLELFFEERESDAKLLEELGAIRLQITSLANLYEQHQTLEQRQEKVREKKDKRAETVKQLVRDKEHLQQKTILSQQHLEGIKATIKDLLLGRETADLQQSLFQIHTRKIVFKDLLSLLGEQKTKAKKRQKLLKEISQISEHKTELEAKLRENTTRRETQQKEIDLLEKNLRLLIHIQSLEEERKLLHDDIPCPLCGSTHHPYNHGNTPEISTEEQILQKSKREMKASAEKCSQITRLSIVAEENLKTLLFQVEETEQQIKQENKDCEQLLSGLELPPLKVASHKQLEEQYQALTKEEQQLEHDCARLEQQTKELNLAGANTTKLATALQHLEQTLLNACHSTASIEQEQHALSEQVTKVLQEIVRLSDELSARIEFYGIDGISGIDADNLPAILDTLNLRVSEWKKNTEAEKLIGPQLITLRSNIEQKRNTEKQLDSQILEEEEKYLEIQKEHAKTGKERMQLFGEKETIVESKRLEQKVLDAQEQYDLLQKEAIILEKEAVGTHALLNRLNEENNTRRFAINTQKDLFNQAVCSSIFSSAQEFLDAKLPSAELAALRSLNEKLQIRKTELLALNKDKELALQRAKDDQPCLLTAEVIHNQLDTLEEQREVLQERIITAKEQLKLNSASKDRSKEQQTMIAAQEKVAGRWNRLHMLIGSADGNKFRNFAQGLTFEMMVLHANAHLQKMNDRYILIRDNERPLDLNVIDTYQADEVRSTKNLSGGESFLVSLALALGLSKMASQNVRVDSLFLDEGFGTLDEEALESALETLAGLREENKLIGIISHIAALKERIPLQIEIIPGSRGESSIKGPGVTMGQL